jgi:hypothetical protein
MSMRFQVKQMWICIMKWSDYDEWIDKVDKVEYGNTAQYKVGFNVCQ